VRAKKKSGDSAANGNWTDIRRWFVNPLLAFDAAWLFQNEKLPKSLQTGFPHVLEAYCGNRDIDRAHRLEGSPEAALSHFTKEINRLLNLWLDEPPPTGLPGQPTARWCIRHDPVFKKIQEAQRARTRWPRYDPDETPWTTVEAGTHVLEHMNLSLAPKVQMLGQRDFRLAALRAARAVFGDFLLDFGSPENIGRCERCDRPFVKGQKKQFCSTKCGRGLAVNCSLAKGRARKMRRLDAVLIKLLKQPLLRKDWVDVLQMEVGLVTADGRLNKFVSQFLRAAKSHDIEALLNRLAPARDSPTAEQEAERKKVEIELSDFLNRIREAQRREDERKVK
jgi:hypothetical protein